MANFDLPISRLEDANLPLSSNDLILLTQQTPNGLKSTKTTLANIIEKVWENTNQLAEQGFLKQVFLAANSNLLGKGTLADPLRIDPAFIANNVRVVKAGVGLNGTLSGNELTINANIVDNLDSNSETSSLSAKQGNTLKNMIEALNNGGSSVNGMSLKAPITVDLRPSATERSQYFPNDAQFTRYFSYDAKMVFNQPSLVSRQDIRATLISLAYEAEPPLTYPSPPSRIKSSIISWANAFRGASTWWVSTTPITSLVSELGTYNQSSSITNSKNAFNRVLGIDVRDKDGKIPIDLIIAINDGVDTFLTDGTGYIYVPAGTVFHFNFKWGVTLNRGPANHIVPRLRFNVIGLGEPGAADPTVTYGALGPGLTSFDATNDGIPPPTNPGGGGGGTTNPPEEDYGGATQPGSGTGNTTGDGKGNCLIQSTVNVSLVYKPNYGGHSNGVSTFTFPENPVIQPDLSGNYSGTYHSGQLSVSIPQTLISHTNTDQMTVTVTQAGTITATSNSRLMVFTNGGYYINIFTKPNGNPSLSTDATINILVKNIIVMKINVKVTPGYSLANFHIF